jgi:hypothetical protein
MVAGRTRQETAWPNDHRGGGGDLSENSGMKPVGEGEGSAVWSLSHAVAKLLTCPLETSAWTYAQLPHCQYDGESKDCETSVNLYQNT